mmetsp:Transcript_39239/g.86066  ORF Transcript_39239/g.86066 Transcript_39239/m.86066 type:complete len:135 (-) Transcript_39239:330-734(-)
MVTFPFLLSHFLVTGALLHGGLIPGTTLPAAPPNALGICRCDQNTASKVCQYESEEGVQTEQAQGKIGEDVIGMDGAMPVGVEGCKQDEILLRHDHHQAKEEADGERGRKALQDEGAENGHCELNNRSPYRRNS